RAVVVEADPCLAARNARTGAGVSASAIIGDWGSTRLRLWRIERGEVRERREGPGIAGLADPASALLAALGDWPAERVCLCGMAGASEGLCTAPYVECPADTATWRASAVTCEIAGLRVVVAAGLSSRDDTGRPDVMRGEETQIFGAMSRNPGLASGRHCALLPGTHSKWAWLDEGRIARFRTCMTGELFALLGNSSLRFAGKANAAEEAEGFAAGLARAGESIGLLEGLFEARAAQMRDGRSSAWAAGFVSGLLIGSEVAGPRSTPPEGPVTVIGDPGLTARYASALDHFGLPHTVADGDACAIAGLGLLDGD
ncbi:MAG TPA: 2-dehydro-3-deoxygalactonokinase, partial [Croceibacterium sp.]|nr:2-dehydro-3-deoxygalactonokinase [Croceibacterium sp.]